MEVSEDEVMKPDHTDKATSLNRASFSLSSDTYLLEKARKLLRGNNRESSPSCSINSPIWNTQLALTVQSKLSPENGPEGQSQATVSVNGSPYIEDANENIKDFVEHVSKKRRREPVWTPQVRDSPENELEVPPDDGYIWTKDGQNEILGAKFPRSYYRCKYKSSYMLNCSAEKIVRRSDDDPTRFVITYIGTHTCNQNMTRLSLGSSIFNFNFFPSNSNASETQYNNANNSSNISSSLLLANLFDYGHHHESGSSNEGLNLSDNVIPEYLSSSIPSLYTFSVQNHTISSDSSAIVSLQEAARLGSKTSNASPSLYSSSVQNHIISPVFSATALLQEATRLGSKTSNVIPLLFKSLVQNHTKSPVFSATALLQEAARLDSKTSNANPSLYSSSVQNHIISPVFSATALLQEAFRFDSKTSNVIPSLFKSLVQNHTKSPVFSATALLQEAARLGSKTSNANPSLYSSSVQNHTINPNFSATVLLQEAARLGSMTSNASPSLYSSSVQNHNASPNFSTTALIQEIAWLSMKSNNTSPSLYSSSMQNPHFSATTLLQEASRLGSITSKANPSLYSSSVQNHTISPNFSATALLQEAAQLGSKQATLALHSTVRLSNF